MAKLGRTVGSTWLVGAVCIALAATVACGGDDDEPGGGQTGGSGGSGGTNAAGASGTGGTAAVGGSAGSAGEAGSSGQAGSAGSTGDTLEVDVFTRDPNDPSKLVPATGAIVAFDLPGGTRVEESVGASETVSFSGIDWSLEPKAAVTAYQQGAMLMSYAGLSKEGVDVLNQLRGQDRLTFVLGSEPLSLVNVAGTASNMASESDVLLVSATIPAAISEAYGTDFSLSVVAGLQFSLVGLEYHGYAASPSGRGMQFTIDQWAELSQDAATADVLDVAFDLSNQLAPNTVTGSFAIPEHGSSGFFESAHGMVRTSSVGSRETGIFGYATEIEVADDEKSFEYTAQYVEPADAPLLFTHYLLFGEDGSTGSFFRPGPIGAGLQDGVPPEPVSRDERKRHARLRAVATDKRSHRLGEQQRRRRG